MKRSPLFQVEHWPVGLPFFFVVGHVPPPCSPNQYTTILETDQRLSRSLFNNALTHSTGWDSLAKNRTDEEATRGVLLSKGPTGGAISEILSS